MNLTLLLSVIYLVVLGYTMIRILPDTHSNCKALAYLMLVVIVPVFGILFYFSFGINYRHRRYNQKAVAVQRAYKGLSFEQ